MKYARFAVIALFAGLTMTAQAQQFPASQPGIWAHAPTADSFEATVEAHIKAATRLIATLKQHHGQRTVANTLAPYDAALTQLNSGLYFCALMEAVHPDAAFRDRATKMTRRVNEVRTALSLDPELYKAMSVMHLDGADTATRYYVNRQLLEFRLSGVDKDEATRNRLKVLNDQLTEQQSKFERNINDGQLIVSVTDARELDGLPQDYIDTTNREPTGRSSSPPITPMFFRCCNSPRAKRCAADYPWHSTVARSPPIGTC